jgi:hypothetical protein
VPPIDKSSFTEAVSSGHLIVHSVIDRVEGKRVFFKARKPPSCPSEASEVDNALVETIILCTGYEADLSWLHLGPTAPEGPVGDRGDDSCMLSMAKARCVDPSLGRENCLFFVGYDPGNSLIPLAAIRAQAGRVADEVRSLSTISRSFKLADE